MSLKETIERESGAGDYFVNEDGSMDRIIPIPEQVRLYAEKHGIPLKPDHIPAPAELELEQHFAKPPGKAEPEAPDLEPEPEETATGDKALPCACDDTGTHDAAKPRFLYKRKL